MHDICVERRRADRFGYVRQCAGEMLRSGFYCGAYDRIDRADAGPGHRVRSAVEGGYYASSSEVIREALRDWKRKQDLDGQRIEELRALWLEGINSSSAGTLNIAEIKREARQRYEEERKNQKV
jgi:antitoxin ParD1/3/4